MRGATLINLERCEEAIENLDKAIALQPDNWIAYYNKAFCYAVQGNSQQAIHQLKQAIDLNPECRETAKIDLYFESLRKSHEFQTLLDGDRNN